MHGYGLAQDHGYLEEMDPAVREKVISGWKIPFLVSVRDLGPFLSNVFDGWHRHVTVVQVNSHGPTQRNG
jgi:hypothetical protein